MAEINSQQVTSLSATPVVKLRTNELHGRQRILWAKLPTTYSALNINDTVYLGDLPGNARIIGVDVSNAAGTASQTMDIGLRSVAGTVISATGVVTGVDTATAGFKSAALNGALVANGLDYTTPSGAVTQAYATVKGAASPANQSLSVCIRYVTD